MRPWDVSPIPLNAEQERAIKEWAADDRLWTTQETVEFNLRTFARVILKNMDVEATMPGKVSEPSKGPGNNTPLVPSWMEDVSLPEPRYGVVPEHNFHGGDGWTILDRRLNLTTGGWFADRIAAERTADVLNDEPKVTGAADDRR